MLTKEQIQQIKETSDDELLPKWGHLGTRALLRSIKHGTLKKQKVLFLDIETAPVEAYVWGIHDQNISIDQIKNDWFILCWSAKWYGDKHVMSDRVTSKESLKRDDKRIIKSLWKLLDEADVVIGHNADQFDIRKINARFFAHGLEYPKSYSTIDTKKIAKREFNLTSNKLDYICRYLGIEGKTKTDMDLWKDAVRGDEKALKQMSKYCDNDVVIDEKIYNKLLPYIRNNPKVWVVRQNSII